MMKTRLRFTLLPLLMTLGSAAPAAGLLQPRDDAADSRLLGVNEAFQVQPALWQNGQLTVQIDIAPGCYLYRDKFSAVVVEPATLAIGKPVLAAGSTRQDEHYGKVAVLQNQLNARYQPKSGSTPRTIRIRYQGCAEGLVCYPPQERELNVEIIR